MAPPEAASARSASIAASIFGPVTSAPVTTTSAGAGACGNARWMAVNVWTAAASFGASTAGAPSRRPSAGAASASSATVARPPQITGRATTRRASAPPAAEERDPAGVRLWPEPGQQRGQHGQRADDRDAHHGDRAEREAAERAAADEEQAGHGGHHGQP